MFSYQSSCSWNVTLVVYHCPIKVNMFVVWMGKIQALLVCEILHSRWCVLFTCSNIIFLKTILLKLIQRIRGLQCFFTKLGACSFVSIIVLFDIILYNLGCHKNSFINLVLIRGVVWTDVYAKSNIKVLFHLICSEIHFIHTITIRYKYHPKKILNANYVSVRL